MKIDCFGVVDVLSWGLVPNHGTPTDGSFMVFNTIADEDTEIYAAVNNDRAWLRLRNNGSWDTYCGITDKAERTVLENLYFGGF